MKKEEGTFVGAGGTDIYWQSWIPDTIRAVCIICHGLGEHSGRYEHVALKLGDEDIASFALDHRGHGKSKGRRGHVNSFGDYVSDVDSLRCRVEERFEDIPKFLIGHSMGGLIAANYAIVHGNGLSGLVLSSAALRVDVDASPVKLALGKVFSRLLPWITMSNELDPKMISHDEKVVELYENDPLVHDRVSARWFTEFMAAMDTAHEGARQISFPVLVMQSGEDALVAPRGAGEFFDRLAVEDKTLKHWEGFYHEMFNEVEREKPLSFMIDWIEERLS